MRGDSAKYDLLGKGLSLFLRELPTALGRLLSGRFGTVDQERYHLNDWILQHAPIYDLLLGAVYSLSGDSQMAGRVLSACLLAGSAALLFALTRRLFGQAAALLASVGFVLWPAHLYFGTAIMTEVPMIFFGLLAAVVLESTRSERRRRWNAAGGAALGLAVLTKSTLRYLAAPALVLDLWPRFREPGRWRFLAFRALGLLLVLGSWALFLRAAGLPQDPFTASGEKALWLYRGNYVPDRGFETLGLGDALTPELQLAASTTGGSSTPEQKRALYEEALRITVSQDPVGWGALVLAKIGWFWSSPSTKEDLEFWFGRLPPPVKLQGAVAVLGLLGVSLAWLQGGRALLLALLASYITMIHALSHLVSRYNLPATAFLLPYAAFAVVQLCRGARWIWINRRLWLGSFAVHRKSLRWAHWAWVPALPLLLLLGERDLWVSFGVGPEVASAVQAGLIGMAFLSPVPAVVAFHRRRGVPKLHALCAGLLFPGLLAPLAVGAGLNHPDSDRFRARLERPGDRIVQEISLPADLDWESVARAELALDLLPSPDPGYRLRVLVNGEQAAEFFPALPSGEEAFLLDREVNAAQERYGRVLRSVKRQHESFVRSRYPQAGYEYFRQWYRLPLEPELLRGKQTVRIELEMVTCPKGSWVDCFGDESIQSVSEGRLLEAPAFFENSYNISNYQFDFFAPGRVEADSRLIRPLLLESPACRSQFLRGGVALGDLSPAPGKQVGEYRLRLRLGLRGGYVSRLDRVLGRTVPIWAIQPDSSDRPLDPEEIRSLSRDRERFFDGYRTF